LITRRSVVGSLSSLALMLSPAAFSASGRRVVVIGAGIIGASIGYHLARRGAQVTIVEGIAPAAGATGKSFAWINSFSRTPRAYHDLGIIGLLEWHRLQQELGAAKLPIQWGGTIQWGTTTEQGESLRRSVSRLQSWGGAAREIGSVELQQLLPGMNVAAIGPTSAIVASEPEGALEPTLVTKAILDQAQRLGARLEYPVAVTGFVSKGGRVATVRTSQGEVQADEVVIAAGLGTTALAASLGASVPLDSSHGVCTRTRPTDEVIKPVIWASSFNARQTPDGSVAISHRMEPVGATKAYGEEVVRSVSEVLPRLAGCRVEEVTMGLRVLPTDGIPVIGHLPGHANVYVAAMHSGVSLAAVVGQLAAIEVLGDSKLDVLAPFRPERFATRNP